MSLVTLAVIKKGLMQRGKEKASMAGKIAIDTLDM